MDSASRRPQLPALSYLDVDKAKREEDAYQSRIAGALPGLPVSSSPTYHYPPGPPPPYSHAHSAHPPAQHANTWLGPPPTIHTPPESRRASEQEKDAAKHTRQLLPSISEALGVDSQSTFSSTAAPPPVLLPTHLLQAKSVAPSSPSPTRRALAMEPPHCPPASFPTTPYSQYPHYRPEPPAHPPPFPLAEATRPPASYPASYDVKPPHQHTQTTPSSSRTGGEPFLRPAEPSPTHEQPPQIAGYMGPPNSFPYGYMPYPPQYANPTPPASVSSGSTFPSSAVHGSHPALSGRKSEASARYDERQPAQATYGESVKRHLDCYDLETSLNEVASTSGILSDFARRYGDRMHHTQRSGASLSSLPGLVEVDDMVAKTRVQMDSLMKIRDVILAQQAAFEQQAADQHQSAKQQFSEATPPQSELHQQDNVDGKQSGFAGVDAKKRRGRAAPPGRCHSCNRAETPEWRRGPDGARTLCNACGLHYAKLTRKNNGVNKNAPPGSSNLRSKENMAQ